MLRSAWIALSMLLCAHAPAQQYPERPLTILAGYPAGGLVDIVSRILAEGMKAKFPKGVVVLNRTGAGGDLWREYRAHTEILKRIGLIKP